MNFCLTAELAARGCPAEELANDPLLVAAAVTASKNGALKKRGMKKKEEGPY